MIFWGLLAFLQVAFLPGFLFLSLVDRKILGIPRIIFSFALSLLLNYIIVLSLIFFSKYELNLLFPIFIAEFLFIIFLFRKEIFIFFNKNIFDILKIIFSKKFKILSSFIDRTTYNLIFSWSRLLNVFVLFGVFVSIYWSFTFLISSFFSFSIFEWHDTIVSWNFWAEKFYSGCFPDGILNYPQLIPSNWSIFYVFTGMPIQYFPKLIMPLFFIFILLLLFDIGTRKKNIAYFFALIFTALLFKNAFGVAMIGSGLVDIPVAFMVMLSIYCLVLPEYAFWGIIFVASAALVKQPGLYILMVYPLLFYCMVDYSKKRSLSPKRLLSFLSLYSFCLLFLVVPFYVYTFIFNGTSKNSVLFQAAVHGGSTFISKLIYSLKIFLSYNLFFLNVIKNRFLHFIIGAISGLIYAFFLAYSLRNNYGRSLLLIIFVPWFFIWAYSSCYDFRNLSIAIPIYAISLGTGLEEFLKGDSPFFYKLINFFGSVRIYIWFMLVALFLLLIDLKYPSNYINSNQFDLVLKKDNEKLNRLLFSYMKDEGRDKMLLSSLLLNRIEVLRSLPHIYIPLSCTEMEQSRGIDLSKERSEKFFELVKNSEIVFLLIPDDAFEPVKKHVNEKMSSGEYGLIFHEYGYLFLERKR